MSFYDRRVHFEEVSELYDEVGPSYPKELVEDILATTKQKFILPGQTEKYDLEVGGQRVHTGTGGAAPMVLDFKTGRYRESRLVDVYDMARLVDTLDNIHYYWRSVVARGGPRPGEPKN